MASTLLVGSSGTGKSFVATSIARHDLRRGRMVFANYRIEGAQLFGLADLMDLPPGRIIIDEAASWFHSRNWKGMADRLLGKWNQTRKDGWELLVATQHEDNVDATIKRNLTYGVLLSPAWKPVTRWDPRVKALARIMTAKRREQFAQYVADGLFPEGTAPPTVSPAEVTHPLYVAGRKWHWADFRKRGVRPVSRHRWWWDWETAMAYDTNEVLEAQTSKGVIL